MEYELKKQLDRIEEKLDIVASAVFEDVDEEEEEESEDLKEDDGRGDKPEYEQE